MARKIKKAFQIMLFSKMLKPMARFTISFSKMLKPMARFTISFSKNVRYL
ncbi:hypothetical protein ACU6Y8_06145 [Klebsiella aerogenes]